jgi:hypothetical protein
MADRATKEQPESSQRARVLQDMLLDALHAMRSMEQVESIEQPGGRNKASDSIIDRIAGFTGSALRLGARTSCEPCSLRVSP